MGLIDIIPNRGAMVRRFTHEEVSEFFQIRALYEGLAARRAAERIAAALLQEVDTVSTSDDPIAKRQLLRMPPGEFDTMVYGAG